MKTISKKTISKKTISKFNLCSLDDSRRSVVELIDCNDGSYCLRYKFASMTDYRVFAYDNLSIARLDYMRQVLFLLSERIY